MKVKVEGPIFYAQEDESLFFSCLSGVLGFKGVRGAGVELEIEFYGELSEQAVIQLLVIFRRWGMSVESLFEFKGLYQPECFLWGNKIPPVDDEKSAWDLL